MELKIKNKPIKAYCGCKAWYDKENDKQSVFLCGLASCGREYCQKLYYLKRIRLVSDLIPEYSLNRFFTLTMNREVPCEVSWKIIPYVWDKTRRILTRKYPGMIFLAILEAHKDGYPHIHGFTNTYIPQKVWSHTFQACGGGSIAYVTRVKVKDGDISAYVSKELDIARYIGKEQVITARDMLEPGARTFWRSQNMKSEYEKLKANVKSDVVLVWDDIYKETEKGFDKRFDISYDKEYGSLRLTRV